MFTQFLPKAGLMSLLVAAAVCAPIGAADASDLKAAKPEVTGAIDSRSGGLAEPAPVVSRARAAVARFAEARAAMEHGLMMSEAAPKSDIAAVRAGMKSLIDDLAAVEQMEQARFASSAKDAKRLADDWYQSGMKIIAPPSNGLTEMPLPMLVKSKADAVSTALDWLAEETAANTTMAANAAAPAATAVKAAQPINVAMPKSMGSVRMHHRQAPSKPMSQNEASARLILDALPLFLPPVALLRRDDSSKR